MRLFALVITLLIPLAVLAVEPVGKPIRLSNDLVVQPLTEHVWLHRSWTEYNGQRVSSNGVIIDDGKTLTLIDTAWGEAPTATLLSWIEQHFGKDPDQAILTHSHDDRMGGSRLLAEKHIRAYVHPKTLSIVKAEPGKYYDPASHFPQALAFHDRRARLGDIELYYPGAAHSPDNIVIWYGRDHLLVGGCAVKGRESTNIGYVAGSAPDHWAAAMDNLIQAFPQAAMVVPGHGQLGDEQLLFHTRALATQALERR
ncbi:beta-lactamase II [Alcanivorax hongdengensis A-11-3]|uniref:beta-lactamase n=1 Tax=Alcanivorax hongdengensis A-11-3 TaxID=1177179 RepID=L0WFQ6_9GAMM|nr:subclass B1 metallo-beta-lactamase [Alcanivorax hongdengensis]EKF75539.1 beta-lactamase II [Alcanivorax hongdengensis A-11-3]